MLREDAGGLPRLVSTTASKVLGLWSQCYSEGDESSFCFPACPEFSSQQWLQLEPPTSKYSPELLKTNTKIQLLLLPTVLKTTVPQRGQPRNQGTKPTNLHALPYSGSLLSGLACSLNSPKENSFCVFPTTTDPLRLAHIFTAISSSCLELLPGLLSCVPSGTWASLQRGFEIFTQQGAVGDQER